MKDKELVRSEVTAGTMHSPSKHSVKLVGGHKPAINITKTNASCGINETEQEYDEVTKDNDSIKIIHHLEA
jgi:hypothetical protein